MTIKVPSTLAGTLALAIVAGAGDTGQFATVTALTTVYEAGSTTQPAHCVVRGSAAPRTGADGKPHETRFELRLPTSWSGRFLYQDGGYRDTMLAAFHDHGGKLLIGTADPIFSCPA
jgi:hypothetical protein